MKRGPILDSTSCSIRLFFQKIHSLSHLPFSWKRNLSRSHAESSRYILRSEFNIRFSLAETLTRLGCQSFVVHIVLGIFISLYGFCKTCAEFVIVCSEYKTCAEFEIIYGVCKMCAELVIICRVCKSCAEFVIVGGICTIFGTTLNCPNVICGGVLVDVEQKRYLLDCNFDECCSRHVLAHDDIIVLSLRVVLITFFEDVCEDVCVGNVVRDLICSCPSCAFVFFIRPISANTEMTTKTNIWLIYMLKSFKGKTSGYIYIVAWNLLILPNELSLSQSSRLTKFY